MVRNNDDDIFIDAESGHYGNKNEGITYEQIVLKQIARTSEEASKEMKPGQLFTNEQGKLEYIPDQRNVFMQCTKTLYDLLQPHTDDLFNTADEAFDTEEENIVDVINDLIDNELKLIKDQRIKNKLLLAKQTGYFDRNSIWFEHKMDKSLTNHRMLFQELIELFIRKRFLLAKSLES